MFSEEDVILYKGILNMYLEQYEQAIEDLNMSIQIKNENDKKNHINAKQNQSINIYSNNSTPLISIHTSKTDLSDVGLCSFNQHESNYNLLLCYLFIKDKDRSFSKVNELIRLCPKKYNREFYLIRGLLNDHFDNKE